MEYNIAKKQQDFNICLSEIYLFESRKVQMNQSGVLSGYNLGKLLDKLQHEYSTKGTPVFGFEMMEENPVYYERQSKGYRDVLLHDILERFVFDYFFVKYDCFTYSSEILISNENQKEFMYWFALKLRQFEEDVIDITDFLNYHLINSFDNNKENYLNFLDSLLTQYGEILLLKIRISIEKLMRKFNDEMDFEISPKKIIGKTNSDSQEYPVEIFTSLNSFLLFEDLKKHINKDEEHLTGYSYIYRKMLKQKIERAWHVQSSNKSIKL